MKKQIVLTILICAAWSVPVFIWGQSTGRKEGAAQMARHILNPAFTTKGFTDIMFEESGWLTEDSNDPNTVNIAGYAQGYFRGWRDCTFEKYNLTDVNEWTQDPNYNPNAWEFEAPENPILYINEDTFRLQPGSSIKYIEIGDPCVVVSYIEPEATGGGIEIDVNDPNLYNGFIITKCTFDMTDPKCDGSNWYCPRCKLTLSGRT